MKGNILLVDDSPMDLKIATHVLEREGYACFGFTHFQDALDWAAVNTPQLIFLDLQMPLISGYQLIPMFKKLPNTSGTPIIIVSGKNQMEDVSKAVALGVSDYLVKPIDALVLQEKVKKVGATVVADEFATVLVPAGALEEVKILQKTGVVAMSEFGLRLLTAVRVLPGETIELSGFSNELFGQTRFFVRCLNVEPSTDNQNLVVNCTFVGITEAQRQTLRKVCRQFWLQSKAVQL